MAAQEVGGGSGGPGRAEALETAAASAKLGPTPATQDELRAYMIAENLRRTRAAEKALLNEPEDSASIDAARTLASSFKSDYGRFISDIDVACRGSMCQVKMHFKTAVDEKEAVNTMARERARWSTGFHTVDYIPTATVDDTGRFLLWRNAQATADARLITN